MPLESPAPPPEATDADRGATVEDLPGTPVHAAAGQDTRLRTARTSGALQQGKRTILAKTRRIADFADIVHRTQGDVRTCRRHRGHQRRQAFILPPPDRRFQGSLRQMPLGDMGPCCAHEALQLSAPRVRQASVLQCMMRLTIVETNLHPALHGRVRAQSNMNKLRPTRPTSRRATARPF